jgi:hypothetical protein
MNKGQSYEKYETNKEHTPKIISKISISSKYTRKNVRQDVILRKKK